MKYCKLFLNILKIIPTDYYKFLIYIELIDIKKIYINSL